MQISIDNVYEPNSEMITKCTFDFLVKSLDQKRPQFRRRSLLLCHSAMEYVVLLPKWNFRLRRTYERQFLVKDTLLFTCNWFSFSALISLLIWWTFWLGIMHPDSSARMALIKPTNGAAGSVLPTLLFTEPTNKVFFFFLQKISAMALASIRSNL